MADNSSDKLDALVDVVAASPGYRGLARELIAAVGARELGKRQSLKETIKATKRKLHQVTGAYFPRQDFGRWRTTLQQTVGGQDREALKAACRAILGQHASTRERLPLLDDFYARTLGPLPPPRRVLDVACGLSPLTIPWMPLAR